MDKYVHTHTYIHVNIQIYTFIYTQTTRYTETNTYIYIHTYYSSFSWSSRIHRLHLCKGLRHTPDKCPRYDIKQSNGEAPVMLEFGGNAGYPFIAIAPRFPLA